MTVRAVDLFAGAGGWDIAAKWLGIETFGIEIDKDAYRTQVAAGHTVFLGDVRNASDSMRGGGFTSIMDGLIASPPCQTFSAAGKGSGRRNLDRVLDALDDLVWEDQLDYAKFDDERTGLVLEPMRWILAAEDAGHPYQWIALEQVPAVLPVWERYAEHLMSLGYSVDVAKLHAEQYGVPQTRTRAILVARHAKIARLPTPTYSRYYPRTPDKLDPGTERWVSMAEWLGWGNGDRVGFPRRDDGRDAVEIDGGAYRARDLREADLPAFNLTEKARSWVRLAPAGRTPPENRTIPRHIDQPAMTVAFGHADMRWLISNTSDNATVRPESEPAPTMHFGNRLNKMTWEQRRNSGPDAARTPRPVDDAPSYTIRASGSGSHPSGTEWVADTSVRVSLEEAAALQTFPPDYPFRGTKTSQFRQIGNAIPPVLAYAILAELIKE